MYDILWPWFTYVFMLMLNIAIFSIFKRRHVNLIYTFNWHYLKRHKLTGHTCTCISQACPYKLVFSHTVWHYFPRFSPLTDHLQCKLLIWEWLLNQIKELNDRKQLEDEAQLFNIIFFSNQTTCMRFSIFCSRPWIEKISKFILNIRRLISIYNCPGVDVHFLLGLAHLFHRLLNF